MLQRRSVDGNVAHLELRERQGSHSFPSGSEAFARFFRVTSEVLRHLCHSSPAMPLKVDEPSEEKPKGFVLEVRYEFRDRTRQRRPVERPPGFYPFVEISL